MFKEPEKVLWRKFIGRMLESGLLLLAVALGVGATAAGFSLLANTQKLGAEMLSSPAYREIVVATQTNRDEMEAPAVVKPAQDTVVLTASDLQASADVPAVQYAYVQSGTELRFLNQKAVAERQQMVVSLPAPPAGGERVAIGVGIDAETLEKAQAEGDVFITEVDQLRGRAVTPQYFDAWNLQTSSGSLFADSEGQTNDTLVVLGAAAAAQVAGSAVEPSSLVGKKLLTWEGYATVVGILRATGNDTIDEAFFSPYQTPSTDFVSGGPPRRMAFNVQLRFAVSNPAQLESAAAALAQVYSVHLKTDQLVVSNPRAEANKLIARNTGIGLLILFLALAALFIASVNVSHILLSRGLRMRKGVGILMALGASKASILRLFAGEGVFLSTIGSLLGAFLAWPLSQTMEASLGLSDRSPEFLVMGMAGAWVLNLAFSVFPAAQNSKIPPADAMRVA